MIRLQGLDTFLQKRPTQDPRYQHLRQSLRRNSTCIPFLSSTRNIAAARWGEYISLASGVTQRQLGVDPSYRQTL